MNHPAKLNELKEELLEEKQDAQDMYDIIVQMTSVRSNISSMNSDFILSDLRPELLNNVVITFVKNELQIIEHINIYLSDEKLQDDQWRKNTESILLNGVFSLVNLSRADKAKVLLAILDFIRGNQPQTPVPTEQHEPGLLSKLNPFKKKEKKEE